MTNLPEQDLQNDNSLIHALVISETGVRKLDWAALRAWQPKQGVLWVHLDGTADAAARWLTDESGLPETVPPALLAEETRPRTNVIGDGVVVNLRGVNLNPGADPEDMVSIRLWVDGDRVISTRIRRLMSMSDVVAALDREPLDGSGDLLARLADALVSRVNDVIDDLDERVASLEERVLREPDRSMRATLGDLRREAISLRRYLAPQREALGRLQGERLSWLTDMDRPVCGRSTIA